MYYERVKTDEETAQFYADKLQILDVKSTEDFVLITGKVQCLVHFAFFKHFIVCSGDYGEWVFDCTWNTVKEGKPVIPEDEYYLISKVSRDCKYLEFDREIFNNNLRQWFERIEKEFEPSEEEVEAIDDYDLASCYLIKEELRDYYTNDDLKEIVDDFDSEDEYRHATHMDEFERDYNEIADFRFEPCDNYPDGYKLNFQFLMNIKMLMKIRKEVLNERSND